MEVHCALWNCKVTQHVLFYTGLSLRRPPLPPAHLRWEQRRKTGDIGTERRDGIQRPLVTCKSVSITGESVIRFVPQARQSILKYTTSTAQFGSSSHALQEALFPGDVCWPLESPFAPRRSFTTHSRNNLSECIGIALSLSQTASASYMQYVTHLKMQGNCTIDSNPNTVKTTFVI